MYFENKDNGETFTKDELAQWNTQKKKEQTKKGQS